MNDKRYLHHWTVMPCTSSTSNVLVCGRLSRSDCEIYDPRSVARQILDVSTQSSDVTRNVQAVATASSNSNYAVFILDGQEFYGNSTCIQCHVLSCMSCIQMVGEQ